MHRYLSASSLPGRRFRNWVVTPLLAAVFVALGGSAVFGHAEHGHPARIHEGSCTDLGPVAFRLNGVGGSVDLDNAPLATPTAVNPETAFQVLVSETTLTAPLAEMLAGEHAVMVYESDEAMDAIACGNLGGAMSGDTLITGLAEAGKPGHVGFALFRPEGEETVVSVIIGHAMAPLSASTGEYQPADGLAAEEDHAHEEGAADHEHETGEEDDHAVATPAP
jgi:hypothetical protein